LNVLKQSFLLEALRIVAVLRNFKGQKNIFCASKKTKKFQVFDKKVTNTKPAPIFFGGFRSF
jgi:hypothetical protein